MLSICGISLLTQSQLHDSKRAKSKLQKAWPDGFTHQASENEIRQMK
jgi:hypothetical protein